MIETQHVTPTIESGTVLATPSGESLTPNQGSPLGLRWSLGFVGMLAYLVVEYSRLSAQYDFLLPLQIGKVVIAICVLGWLISPRQVQGRRSTMRWLDMLLFLLILASFLSACVAFDRKAAWSNLADLLRWIMIYFLISRIVVSNWRLRIFTFFLLLLNLKLAQAAIRSYILFKQIGVDEEILARIGVGAGSVGFFANQGDFGVAMCVVWPLGLLLMFGENRKLARYMLMICVISFTVAILLSGSRGALLGLAMTALIGWARNPKRIMGAAIIVLLALAFVYVLPRANKERLQSAFRPETDKTASIRLTLWKAGLLMFTEHPVLGVGPGNYMSVYSARYVTDDTGFQVYAPHSIYIQALSELGLAGTSLFVAIVSLIFRLNSQTRKRVRAQQGEAFQRSFEYRMAMGLDLALVAYLVSGAFLTVLYYPHLWILMGLTAGLFSSCGGGATQQESPDSSTPRWGNPC